MSPFQQWLATSPIASFLKVFAAFFIGAVVANWASAGSISFDAWQTWVIGALVAAAPVLVNALNPADTRYGLGSGGE